MDLVFQGYHRAIRFGVSRDRGFPLAGWDFQKFGVSKIQGFQGTNDTPGRYPTPLGALI